jgi:hypothetical protein
VVRPPRARREKPRVSAFTSADIPKILDLNPDLVLTFSDLADIAATLIRHGIEVHAFNQRTVPQILDMIKTLNSLIGATDRAERLAQELAASLVAVREQAAQLPRRPRVYFEEWDDPMISGVGWVSELVEVAGGVDVFADRSSCKLAKDRIVTAEEIIRHAYRRYMSGTISSLAIVGTQALTSSQYVTIYVSPSLGCQDVSTSGHVARGLVVENRYVVGMLIETAGDPSCD